MKRTCLTSTDVRTERKLITNFCRTLAIEIKKLALSTNEITLSTQQDVRATKTVSEDVQTKLDTLETSMFI